MNCEEIKYKLSQYVDGLLDESEARRVEEHLEKCSECSAYYQDLLKLGEMADDFEIGGDESYWVEQKDKILDKIDKAESEKITPVPVKKSKDTYYRFLAVAAAVALVAFVSIFESMDTEPTKGLFSRKEKTVQVKSLSEVSDEMESPDKLSIDSESEQPGKSEVSMAETASVKKKSRGDESQASIEGRSTIDMTRLSSDAMDGEESAVIGIPKPVSVDEAVDHDVVVIQDQKTDLEEVSIPSDDADETSFHKQAANLEDISAKSGDFKEDKQIDNLTTEISDFQDKMGNVYSDAASVSEPLPEIAEESIPIPEKEQTQEELIEVPQAASTIEEVVVEEPFAMSEVSGVIEDDGLKDEFEVDAPLPSLSRVEYDPAMFEGYSEEEINTYFELKERADIYHSQYVSSVSYSPDAFMGISQVPSSPPIKKDSLKDMILEIAKTYHELGLITPDDKEWEEMIDRLNILKEKADSESIDEIEQYISDLESQSE